MVQFENQYRQIKVKIVYYGPALGGKTTCLQHIHRVTDPQRRTRLYSLNTASDRTLFFDLLSLNLGRIRGYRLAIQLYTVPGQVQYNATRRAVLAGADGVVFVADSQGSQAEANRQSFDNLKENLEANGIDPSSLPLVLQYNKRDLNDLMPIDELESDLNAGALPSFPTIAITGDGVMDAFAAITETTLVSLADRLGIDTTGHAVERLQQQTRAALDPFLSATSPDPAASDVEITVPDTAPDETGPLPQETLVSEAVRANLAMTDLSTRLETVSKQLERKVRVTRAITDFGRTIANQGDPANVLRLLVKTAATHLGVQGSTVMVAAAEGQLQEAVVHGVDSDPLLAARLEEGSVASFLAAAGEPVLIASDLEGDTAGPVQIAVERAGFGSAIAVPLTTQDRLMGLLAVYGGPDRRPLDDDDLELATILGATAVMGYANALAFRQLEESKTDLESTVEQRSEELKTTLDEVRRLNDELTRLDGVKNELIVRVADLISPPVTALVTAAGALDRLRDAPAEKTARFVGIITSEAAKLAEIVESAAQASLLVSDGDDACRRPSSLPDLLRSSVAPLRDLARQREVELKVLSPGDLQSISCDSEPLATAVRAVIKNAVEHSPRGGEVKVEVHRVLRGDEPWIELRVSDAGEGIPERDLDRVFDPFWQGDSAARDPSRGIGLGLVIAKQVVERHGGRISIARSEPVGTRVSMMLPQQVGC
jgi:signal transduction histidine kinase/signal recognition particle receptor subunit beta